MNSMSDITVRPIADDELTEWIRACNAGFLRPLAKVSDEVVANRRASIDYARTLGAFDGDRIVATFRSFAQQLTAPGGTPVPADAVSNVTVSPTHRRRGLLNRMMSADLAAANERGDVVATLISAEYPIYGRYGFGPATVATEWTIDVPRAGLDARGPGPDDGARIDLVDGGDVRKEGPALHDRLRARTQGVVDRDERWWLQNTGQLITPENPWTEPFYALYRAPSGEVEGLVAYKTDDEWTDASQPRNTLTVLGLIAVTPDAERALWRYLCSIDWVTTVKTDNRAPDDLLPLFLPDPRAARLSRQTDWLWVRILDVVRALESRTYGTSGSLVLEIADPAGFAAGRYRLDATPDGAVCAPTADPAELSLGVGELGTLWLGDESAVRLAGAGRVTQERAGAAAAADSLFRTPRRPWCPDIF
ncbi:GNAT family N-acetyltransferase [Streptomyces sp. NBC_01381]|uniref:GNAT family N-acetyltransferase n=1 Tax=Streptomyces sp. NBC_01381 TaxID=2903845 RepID=UPI00225A1797|nr:GNAT family N-acetyltransferase [Streptomyces sp. NBC_01381]MCX4666095.1 GNAT family N-acetyltransferase [Streptomyces sp. NBC_01381]